MSKALRYEDTVAYESDLVQEQLDKDLAQEAAPKPPPALGKQLPNDLQHLGARSPNEAWAICVCIPINFFPIDRLKKIALNSVKIRTQHSTRYRAPSPNIAPDAICLGYREDYPWRS